MGITQHLIVLMHNWYTRQETTVRTEYWETEFPVTKSVRQGCTLSPYLLNLYAEDIIKKGGLDLDESGLKLVEGTLAI